MYHASKECSTRRERKIMAKLQEPSNNTLWCSQRATEEDSEKKTKLTTEENNEPKGRRCASTVLRTVPAAGACVERGRSGDVVHP